MMEKNDWSTACIAPLVLPYVITWFEHINFYLKPYNLRLFDLLPFENAYILCVRDDDSMLQKLASGLAAFGIGVNERSMMNKQQVSEYIAAVISG